MATPADEAALGSLHTKVAEVLTEALDGQVLPDYTDPDTGEVEVGGKLAPSAALITCAITFLKNNNITCVADKGNALGALEQKMKERQEKRAARATRADIADADRQTAWLEGKLGHVGTA